MANVISVGQWTIRILILLGMLTATAVSAAPLLDAAQGEAAGVESVVQTGPFSDMPTDSWAYAAVAQLGKDGILKGYPDGTLKGNRPMTRYEAAVLAYRAVEEIEERITSGRAVDKADVDLANKLDGALHSELQAVERHVSALQSKEDAATKTLAKTSDVANASAAITRRAQVHVLAIFRATSYGQQIQANVGPLPIVFNGNTYGPGQALPAGIGSAPTGTAATGPYTTPAGVVTNGAGPSGGLSWGNQPLYSAVQNSNTTGSYNHGLGTQFLNLKFGGNPDDRSQFLLNIVSVDRYSATNYYPQETPSACTAATVGIAATPCNPVNASPLNADGYLTNFVRLQDAWYQYTSPGGIYVKVGKFVQDEGPKGTQFTNWGLGDYVNGARAGYRDARFNVQAGYGFEDTAAQQALLYGLPFSSQVMWAESDYQLDRKGHTDVGGWYMNYSGFHQILWDSYAVNCVGTGAITPGAPAGTPIVPRTSSKVIPLIAGQAFTAGGCGSGYTPIVYGAPGANAGLPVTGAYLSTGPGAQAPHTSMLGAFIIGNYGQLRVEVSGTDKLGNDPTTNLRYTNNLSGFFQIDYGQFLQAPGARGKYSAEIGGWAAGFNSLSPSLNYYPAGTMWSQYSIDPSGYYFAYVGIKKFLTDTAYVGIFYNHMGLLPGAIIPAGSASCPGCVITGDSRNAVFGELNLAF